MWGNKFKAKRVAYGDFSFASQLEAAVYQILLDREKRGLCTFLQAQPSVALTRARILYKPDFVITEPSGEVVYVEAKGVETASWRIKRKLWLFYGPGKLEIWKGTHKKPFLYETLVPKSE